MYNEEYYFLWDVILVIWVINNNVYVGCGFVCLWS